MTGRTGGRSLEFSNLDKVMFPESGITKGDLVTYYRRIADVALPHWCDRPLSLHRFPDGIGADGFFQKNVPDYFPDWIGRVELAKEGGTVTHALASEPAVLPYLADQGCITFHLGLSRRDRPDRPDRLIFDLDPSDDDFAKIQQAAARLGDLLDELDLTSFVMSTGSRGLHVVLPLDRSADFEASRAFARRVAELLAARHPDEMTVEVRKNRRGKRVFIDYLRNAYGQTAVAPYAVRAIERAPVAVPLRWDEALRHGLSPRHYTIRNVFRRLGQIGQPWAGLGPGGASIGEARDRLERVIGRRDLPEQGGQDR